MIESQDILGVSVSTNSKPELVSKIESILSGHSNSYIATVNPEFIVAAQTNSDFRNILNESALNVADGIGIVWSTRFLDLRVTQSWLRSPQILIQWVVCLFAIIFAPRWLHGITKSRAPGTELFWDIAEIAENNDLSIFLIGGFEDTPRLVGEKLKKVYPNLRIAGTSNLNYTSKEAPKIVALAKPDIVYVAFGAVKQETWMRDHLDYIGARMMIGLGGTFDYVSGAKAEPSRFIRKIGLEWLFRLVTQPSRYKRIYNAIVVFPVLVLKSKLANKGS